MSIRYALLGLLREQPDHGYKLKQRFEERVGRVWNLNIGQVYQTLRTLESHQLIQRVEDREESVEDSSYPTRKRFELTGRGTKQLEAWLRRRPSSPRPLRDELLIRLLVLEPERRDEALDRISAQERTYKEHLSRLVARKRRLARRASEGSPRLATWGLQAAILHTEVHLRWLEHCSHALTCGDSLGYIDDLGSEGTVFHATHD